VRVKEEKRKMIEAAEFVQPSRERLLLSKNDAAFALNISRRKLEYLIAEKELRVRRIGKHVLITRRDLECFANGR
jgi:excisionase family DNA binding protein